MGTPQCVCGAPWGQSSACSRHTSPAGTNSFSVRAGCWCSRPTDVAHATSAEGADLRSKPGACPALSPHRTWGQRGCGTSPRGSGTTAKGHRAHVGSGRSPRAGQGCSSFQPPRAWPLASKAAQDTPSQQPRRPHVRPRGPLGGLLLRAAPRAAARAALCRSLCSSPPAAQEVQLAATGWCKVWGLFGTRAVSCNDPWEGAGALPPRWSRTAAV